MALITQLLGMARRAVHSPSGLAWCAVTIFAALEIAAWLLLFS
jgi:hypothetical protein